MEMHVFVQFNKEIELLSQNIECKSQSGVWMHMLIVMYH